MSRQHSKRSRELSRSKPKFFRAIKANPDNSNSSKYAWVHRPVRDPFATEKISSALTDNGDFGIAQRLGYFSTTLLYAEEIAQAVSESPMVDYLRPGKLNFELGRQRTPSFEETATARIKGLGQFGSMIGLKIEYSVFEEEREHLLSVLKSITHTEFEADQLDPHINIGKGKLSDVPHKSQVRILENIPPVLALEKAKIRPRT